MPKWTGEARACQAALIREWKPWEESTGLVTRKGKRKSSMNYLKGSRGSMIRIMRMIRSALGR